MNQLRQIISTFNLTRQADPSFLRVFAAATGGTILVLVLLMLLAGGPLWIWIPLLILLPILAGLIVLGRRAQAASLAQIEGQPGAAAAVLQNMRGAWEVTPAVAFNRREDLVHLAIGRPGVVLVAEGSSSARVKALLTKEQRRFERAAGEVPVSAIVVGHGEDEVELGALAIHLAKMPKALAAKEVGPLNRKLSALGASRPPMPKGPVGGRPPKRYR